MSFAPVAPNCEGAPSNLRSEPEQDCILCPRLAEFLKQNRTQFPEWFNAPVPSFGGPSARLLIVGLAPGLRGANRTGRPFTGDYAGVLLYETLIAFGFARGSYGESPGDGLELVDCRITNAVRCVPPQNKPLPAEISTCTRFLSATIAEMPNLSAVLVLGRIAFEATLRASSLKPSQYSFSHGCTFDLGKSTKLFGSYHCSRYNTNTGRLTPVMFHRVFEQVTAHLNAVK